MWPHSFYVKKKHTYFYVCTCKKKPSIGMLRNIQKKKPEFLTKYHLEKC